MYDRYIVCAPNCCRLTAQRGAPSVVDWSMSTVKLFTESTTGRVVEIDAPEGAALVDLCDEYDAPIPFSCRSASCGTCRIHVLEGAEHLSPAAEDELDLLDVFNHKPPLIRLTCQAKLMPGATTVRIKAFHDE
jgi:ferredoxin